MSTGNWLCAYAITRNRPSTLDIGPVPRLIGYRASRSWRDYVSPEGELLEPARERLAHGQTGVQLGRAALS